MATNDQLMQEVENVNTNITPVRPTNKSMPGAPRKTEYVQGYVYPFATDSNLCRCLFSDNDESSVTMDYIFEPANYSLDDSSDDDMPLQPIELIVKPQYTKW